MKKLILIPAIALAMICRAQTRDTTLTIVLHIPASKVNSFLTAQQVNVDTLSTISAKQASVIKQDAVQTGQYIIQELSKAMQPVWERERKVKK